VPLKTQGNEANDQQLYIICLRLWAMLPDLNKMIIMMMTITETTVRNNLQESKRI